MHFEWANSLTDIDAVEILAIINAVAKHEGTNGIPRPLTDREGEEFISALRGAIARGDCYQLLARADEGCSLVAIATLERVKMNPARQHVVEIKRMASAPEARSFGNYLLAGWRVILDKCRELGCALINIDVSEDGPYRMWEKLGFRVYAKVPDYARVGTRTLDGYFLSVYVEEAYKVLERFQRGALRESTVP
jgi:hypothetical protein